MKFIVNKELVVLKKEIYQKHNIVLFLQITLYELPNFEGRSKIFTKKNANLIDAGFFDCASSVEVQAGVYVFFYVYVKTSCK